MSVHQRLAKPEGVIVVSEPILPLPTDHVFVLKLQESHGRPDACRAGRIEHLASGEAVRFATPAELWIFVDKILTEPKRREDRS